MSNTPNSERLHIGIYGKTNSGKSSLLNAITNQAVSVVSDVAGTTTDAVLKPMEVKGIGACVFIDTAGFDDDGALGNLRVENTKKAVLKTDIAILIFSSEDFSLELEWYNFFKENNICVIPVINKSDLFTYCGK
ncbi:MAG: GTPase, partial [Oscillospiraceae bacterium]